MIFFSVVSLLCGKIKGLRNNAIFLVRKERLYALGTFGIKKK